MKISIDHETNKVRIDLSLFEVKTLRSEDKEIARKLQSIWNILE